MAQCPGRNLQHKGCVSRLKLSVIFLIVTNVPMALYMSLFHQVSFFHVNIFCNLLFSGIDLLIYFWFDDYRDTQL
jgi:hypothetical protein